MPETVNPGPHGIQNAIARKTEGQRVGSTTSGSQRQRGPGRPKGAKNKPKSLMPKELADSILLKMKDMLPPEHFEYMRGVIREGKAISTKTEIDTLILLLSRNLMPALVLETAAGTDEMPEFRKDVTERLKVLNSLLALKNQVEKREPNDPDDEKPLLRILGSSRLDPSRVRILVGVESGTMVGDLDGTGRQTDSVGAVSDQISSGQELLSSGEQGETDRVLDNNSVGGDSPSGN